MFLENRISKATEARNGGRFTFTHRSTPRWLSAFLRSIEYELNLQACYGGNHEEG